MNVATPIAVAPVITGLPDDLNALAREIHQGNIDAGWWKTGCAGFPPQVVTLPRNIGELLCLVHSEISEADEGFNGDLQDDKLPHRRMAEVELADTAIRVLDILGFYHVEINDHEAIVPIPTGNEFGDYIRLMHQVTSRAMEGFRKEDNARGTHELIKLLLVLQYTSLVFAFDLAGAIAEKRAFNATRSDHQIANRAAVGGKKF